MNAHNFLPSLPATRHIRIEFDAINHTYWSFMHATARQSARPCCSLPIIEDGIAIQEHIARLQTYARERHEDMPLTHLVLGSDANVFNLGGDLSLFAHCIETGDRATLLQYALRCVTAVAGFQDVAGDGSVHSIAVVQGDALGGGFEVALSCNTLIAEQGVQIGFPEVLFGLFPGMGAYSLLKRRLSAVQAKRMILDGRMFSPEELYSMGIVDVVAPRGMGMEVANNIIRHQSRAALAHRAVGQIYAKYDAVTFLELEDITTRWVDAAMRLGEKGLRTIERIVRAQERRFNPPSSAVKPVVELVR